jgi:hypothetical protein
MNTTIRYFSLNAQAAWIGNKLNCAHAVDRRRPNRWRAGATVRNHNRQQGMKL